MSEIAQRADTVPQVALNELTELFYTSRLRVFELQQVMSTKYYIPQRVSEFLIKKMFSKEERTQRSRNLLSTNLKETLAEKDLTGNKTHRWKGGRRFFGEYWYLTTPEWYTGKAASGYVAEHILVYCETHSLTEIPQRHEIHHKDLCKVNNDPTNLEMLSKSEHTKVHHRISGGIL